MSKEFELMEANRKLEELRQQASAETDLTKRDAANIQVSEQTSKVQAVQAQPEPSHSPSTSPARQNGQHVTTRTYGSRINQKEELVINQTREFRQGANGTYVDVTSKGTAFNEGPRNVSQDFEPLATPEPTHADKTRDALIFDGMPSRGIDTEGYGRNQAEALGKTWSAPETTNDREMNGIGGQQQEIDRSVALEAPVRAIAPGEQVRGQVTKSFEHDGERFYSLATEKGERVVVPAGRTSRDRGDTVEAAHDEVGYAIDGRGIERQHSLDAMQQQQRQQQQRSL